LVSIREPGLLTRQIDDHLSSRDRLAAIHDDGHLERLSRENDRGRDEADPGPARQHRSP
jgi:hypothetical protein